MSEEVKKTEEETMPETAVEAGAAKAAEEGVAKKVKKNKRQILKGRASIQCTYNNTIVSIADLNGAILGMKKVEIDRKLDEIIAFSGIQHHIDSPVKRYSSGMYMRLAFAVAAHLEPEILIVDEVLAVGDAQFQKKCLGKMEDVSKNEGRTVLFVSHNMAAIQVLTNVGMFLNKNIFSKVFFFIISHHGSSVRLAAPQ